MRFLVRYEIEIEDVASAANAAARALLILRDPANQGLHFDVRLEPENGWVAVDLVQEARRLRVEPGNASALCDALDQQDQADNAALQAALDNLFRVEGQHR